MNTTETNAAIHTQLTQLAQTYFAAIVDAFTTADGCQLNPGNYSASDVTKERKNALTGYFAPSSRDEKFDEFVTVSAGSFEMSFVWRDVLRILTNWEKTMKTPSREKAVFSVGAPEEKTAPAMTTADNQTWQEKKIKLQRVRGDWWAISAEVRKGKIAMLYYELNGVMFTPLTREDWAKYIGCGLKSAAQTLDNLADRIITCLNGDWAKQSAYFTEVRRRARIGEFPPETFPVEALAAVAESLPGFLAALQIAAKYAEIEAIAQSAGIAIPTDTAPAQIQAPQPPKETTTGNYTPKAETTYQRPPKRPAYRTARKRHAHRPRHTRRRGYAQHRESLPAAAAVVCAINSPPRAIAGLIGLHGTGPPDCSRFPHTYIFDTS